LHFELDIPPIGITSESPQPMEYVILQFLDQCRIWGNLTLVLVVLSLILVPLAIAGIIGGILTDSSTVIYKNCEVIDCV